MQTIPTGLPDCGRCRPTDLGRDEPKCRGPDGFSGSLELTVVQHVTRIAYCGRRRPLTSAISHANLSYYANDTRIVKPM